MKTLHFSSFKRLILIALAATAVVLFKSCGSDDTLEENIVVQFTSEVFDLGTHVLRGTSTNERGTTVIYESGLGHDGGVWNIILREVGKQNRGVSYHRGGYSTSELGPEPRDLIRLSSELKQIKDQVAPNERVVLVGHSWGGAIIRAYTIRYPGDLAGLVFVDPSHENELILTQTQEDDIVANYASLIGASKESEQLKEGVIYLQTLPDLPNIPITVLTNSSEGSNSQWAAYHRSLGQGVSGDNFQQIITNTGHNIHSNEPNLVIDAINDLIDRLN